MPGRRLLASVFAGCAAAVVIASAAWACTENADIAVEGRNSGVVGSEVTVHGQFFHAQPVEVRWGSATGPVVASAHGPEFWATFNVPSDARGGVHYIVGTQAGSSNPPVPFKVTAPASAPVASESAAGPAASQAAPTAETPQEPAAEPATPQPLDAAAEAQAATAPDRQTARPARSTATATASRAPVAPVGPAVASPAASTAQPGPQTAVAEVPVPSSKTAAGDVWSGFAAGDPTAAPSFDTPLPDRDGASSAPALMLLAAGFGGLAAGGLAVQRRRAMAVRR